MSYPSEHVIVLSRDDTAALLARIADLEELDLERRIPWEAKNAVEDLSRIASIIGGQVEAQ